MPIFRNKFSPKKAPLRKNGNHLANDEELEDIVLDNRTVSLQLGNNNLTFQDGEWIPENGKDASMHKINQKLKKKLNELQEENYLLTIKFEVLMNLLTQTTAESHIQQREIQKLKKGINK